MLIFMYKKFLLPTNSLKLLYMGDCLLFLTLKMNYFGTDSKMVVRVGDKKS
jgi:hypothetical protein